MQSARLIAGYWRYVAEVESEASTTVEIYTDGACLGNPGPGGWGALLKYGEHEKALCGGSAKDTTNNRMELTAPIQALASLKRAVPVRLYTDSTYVRDGITKWVPRWKNNGWMTTAKQPVKNVDLWQQLDLAVSTHQVEWHWVKGHAGHPGNERADELAAQGLRDALIAAGVDESAIPPPRPPRKIVKAEADLFQESLLQS